MNIKFKKTILLLKLIIVISAFNACDNYKPDYESPTIEAEKMSKVMTDVHIVEAYLQNIEAVARDSVRNMLYDQLFKIHGIDTTEFYKNHKLYFSHSELVEPLYEDVLKHIEEEVKMVDKNNASLKSSK